MTSASKYDPSLIWQVRVGKVIRTSAANMVVLQKLLKELRGSTARLSAAQFPLGAVRAILRALLVQQPHERLGSNGADEARSFHEPS